MKGSLRAVGIESCRLATTPPDAASPEDEFDGRRAIGELPRDRVVTLVGDAPFSSLQAELEIDRVSRVQSPQLFGPVEGSSGQAEKQVEVQESKRRFGRKQQDDGAKIPRESMEHGTM